MSTFHLFFPALVVMDLRTLSNAVSTCKRVKRNADNWLERDSYGIRILAKNDFSKRKKRKNKLANSDQQVSATMSYFAVHRWCEKSQNLFP